MTSFSSAPHLHPSLPPPPSLPLCCISWSQIRSGLRSDQSVMSVRSFSQDDDSSSLLSRLGCDSPRPRMKFGGMFCNVEGAFENKTLNFDSFSPNTQRRRGCRTQTEDGRETTTRGGVGGGTGGGQTVVFPSGHNRQNYRKKEVHSGFTFYCKRFSG